MGFSTDAIHAGQQPDAATGAVTVPIYQTSTFVQEALGHHKGFEYARTSNPTRLALEKNIAVLEQGKAGFAFASGMAAITATIMLLKAGDHVIVTDNVYGGTYRLFTQIITKLGMEFDFVDTSNLENIRGVVRPNTNFLMAVDNTFMSPYFQRPLALGADIVLHSSTKYLNGHSDGVGGVMAVASDELAQKIAFIQNSAGAVLAPFEAWLVLRGIKTLALRMQRHNENAIHIAEYLQHVKKVQHVYYPGLSTHPQYELAKKQCSGFGGMISFDVGSLEKATRVVESAKIFSLAESLGGVESLIGHPVSMTHASVPKEKRLKMGLTDGIVRLSVGVEDVEDLIGDLGYALDQI
jgi:cystathionine beta-lyase/cystathionine gamma-synthase